MAQRKRKQDRTTRKAKQKNPADSAGTDGSIEGQSPAENCTDRVYRATRATEQAKQKQIATTKQADTTLVFATPSTVPPATRFTHWSTQLAARSQAPLPPDATSGALLTQDELARSDELCELQQQEGSCWSQVTVACFFICRSEEHTSELQSR